MRQYSLTKRGKYVIVAGIILLFVLPSLILAVWALSRDAMPDEPIYESNNLIQNGTAQDSPEPIPEIPPDEDPQDDDTGTQEDIEPPLTGPIDYDFEAGTMTFLLTPHLQTALDGNTTAMLAELLKSPKNTDDSIIVVEIPQLPGDDVAILTAAITDAFAEHGVPLGDIIFFVYQPEPDALTFEISVSFQ